MMAAEMARARITAAGFGRIVAWKNQVLMWRYGIKLRAEKT